MWNELNVFSDLGKGTTQPAFSYSNFTIEVLEQCVKYV